MNDKRNCISCGMPLRSKDDYPAEDTTKEFCRHCADENGNLKPFEQAVEGMAHFIMKMQGINFDKAKEQAHQTLVKNPAWKLKEV